MASGAQLVLFFHQRPSFALLIVAHSCLFQNPCFFSFFFFFALDNSTTTRISLPLFCAHSKHPPLKPLLSLSFPSLGFLRNPCHGIGVLESVVCLSTCALPSYRSQSESEPRLHLSDPGGHPSTCPQEQITETTKGYVCYSFLLNALPGGLTGLYHD